MADKSKVRATLIEIFSRLIPIVKDKNSHVYWNGEDNLYPSEIEGIIINSPTAKRSAKLFAKYIGGSGVFNPATNERFKYSELPYVNIKKAYKITDLIRIASENIAYQYGVFFHIGYGINDKGELYQKSIDVLEYSKCRISKEDDNQNAGKIYYKDFNEKQRFGSNSKEKSKWFYPYNPDIKVVTAQIAADAKDVDSLSDAIEKYRGQVFYLNLSPQFKYALSPFDSVYNDADTEYRISLYSNTQTRTSFLGKLVVVTAGLDDEKAAEVKRDLAQWLGAENSGSMYHIDCELADDITKVINIQQIKPLIDDRLFVETDKRGRRNIFGAANNIPEALVNIGDGALFGTSGDTYREMKLFYCEQVQEEQEKLQETLAYLGFPVIIEPIVKAETVTEVTTELTPAANV